MVGLRIPNMRERMPNFPQEAKGQSRDCRVHCTYTHIVFCTSSSDESMICLPDLVLTALVMIAECVIPTSNVGSINSSSMYSRFVVHHLVQSRRATTTIEMDTSAQIIDPPRALDQHLAHLRARRRESPDPVGWTSRHRCNLSCCAPLPGGVLCLHMKAKKFEVFAQTWSMSRTKKKGRLFSQGLKVGHFRSLRHSLLQSRRVSL